MTIKLVEIIFTTNGDRVLDKLTGKTTKNTAATNANSAATATNEAASSKAGIANLVRSKRTDAWTSSIKKNTAAQWLQTRATKALNAQQRTAGINIGMLSLRIGEWLVPVLGLAYTAMLPVIAGLLAMASAAALAMGGLIGVMGLGLWKWSDQYNQSMDSPFNRRPDVRGGANQNFLGEILKDLKDVLDDPVISGKVSLATSWTRDIFGITLPNALRSLIEGADMEVLGDIVGRFARWLPRATGALSRFASELYRVIGVQTLAALDNFISYLSGGIMNTATWLKAGGIEQLGKFFSIIGDFIGLALDLGKSVLPVLVRMLESVYPSPIKPVVQLLTDFFNVLNKSDEGMNIVSNLARLFVAYAILGGAIKLLNVAVRLVRLLPLILALGLVGALPRIIFLFLARVGLFLGILLADIAKGFVRVLMWIYEQIGKILGIEIEYDKSRYQMQNPFDFFLGDENGYVDTTGMPYGDKLNWLVNLPEVDMVKDNLMSTYDDGKNTYIDMKLLVDGEEVAYAIDESLVRQISGNTSGKKNIGIHSVGG